MRTLDIIPLYVCAASIIPMGRRAVLDGKVVVEGNATGIEPAPFSRSVEYSGQRIRVDFSR
jgi:hypothetical protein